MGGEIVIGTAPEEEATLHGKSPLAEEQETRSSEYLTPDRNPRAQEEDGTRRQEAPATGQVSPQMEQGDTGDLKMDLEVQAAQG